MLERRGSRNHEHEGRALEEPGECDLRATRAVPHRYLGYPTRATRQLPEPEREPGEERDPLALTRLENPFGMAVGDVVSILDADDRDGLACLGHLPRVDVGEADVPDLPLLLELGERAEGFLERHQRIHRMELVEVDSLDAQAP